MRYRVYRAGMPENPVLQFIALVAAAVVAVGAVFLGAILLSLFLGLAVIAGLVLYIRLWWLRRKSVGPSARDRQGKFVEVEYTVVGERSVPDDQAKETED